jgi:hypothetical protein
MRCHTTFYPPHPHLPLSTALSATPFSSCFHVVGIATSQVPTALLLWPTFVGSFRHLVSFRELWSQSITSLLASSCFSLPEPSLRLLLLSHLLRPLFSSIYHRTLSLFSFFLMVFSLSSNSLGFYKWSIVFSLPPLGYQSKCDQVNRDRPQEEVNASERQGSGGGGGGCARMRRSISTNTGDLAQQISVLTKRQIHILLSSYMSQSQRSKWPTKHTQSGSGLYNVQQSKEHHNSPLHYFHNSLLVRNFLHVPK